MALEDVEEHLIDLAGVAGHRGDVLETGLHADRLLVELVAEGFERRAEGGVEVHLLVFGLVEPGEVAEVLHDRADPLQALGRAVEHPAEVLPEVSQVHLLLQPGDLGGEVRLGPGQDGSPSPYLSSTPARPARPGVARRCC